MLETKIFTAEIEEKPVVPGHRTITVAILAENKDEAVKKFDWLIGDRSKKNWYGLEELGDVE